MCWVLDHDPGGTYHPSLELSSLAARLNFYDETDNIPRQNTLSKRKTGKTSPTALISLAFEIKAALNSWRQVQFSELITHL